MNLISRTPRTVLGALVPGVLSPGAATRLLCVVRAREASSLRELGQVGTASSDGEAPNHPLVERGPRTPAPYPASQIARSR
ncbi:hypothetical protein GCM10010256_84500 [Streptomyces coeruleorubidus]|nr:hypothetical protein GCM10010256_84500 [Streptomyces coeruleorubidus]